ncbi:MAG: hypothetical protein IJ530_15490 [Treponema sp.]|uniref:hypothetical protein n=1 Tax=Treponema sp. TaxID=166 RepID=UPI0026011CA0|nr:hypothetical protein [Treponema sp.]MBQ8681134.1 hypothetical protein [Treponema sp.]
MKISEKIKCRQLINNGEIFVQIKCKEKQDYVHCNYGWGGKDDEGKAYSYRNCGYYKSGVFASNLNKGKKMVPNIQPKNNWSNV